MKSNLFVFMEAINYYEDKRQEYFVREIVKYYNLDVESEDYEMTIKKIMNEMSDEEKDTIYAKNKSFLFKGYKKKLERGFGVNITNKTAIDILNRKFEYKVL